MAAFALPRPTPLALLVVTAGAFWAAPALAAPGDATPLGEGKVSEPEASAVAAAPVLSRGNLVLSRYEVPADCPAPEKFVDAIEEALGDAKAPAVEIEVEVALAHGRPTLALRTRSASGSGERRLDATSCDELIATAAVVVSLALEPELLFRNEHPMAAADASVDDDATAESNTKPLDDDEVPDFRKRSDFSLGKTAVPIEAEPYGISVQAESAADPMVLPRTAIATGVSGTAHLPPHQVSFRLLRFEEQSADAPEASFALSFDLIVADIEVCRDLRKPLHLPVHGALGLCALLSVGRIGLAGVDIRDSTPQTLTLVMPGTGAYWDRALWGPLRVRLHGEVLVQLRRPRFFYHLEHPAGDMSVELHKIPAMGARFGLSLGLMF